MFRLRVHGVLLLAMAGAASACVTSPPVQEMSDARQAISAAELADAARLAPDNLDDARRFLVEAERQLLQEAYGLARMNAIRAKNRAVQALTLSEVASDGGQRN